MGSEVYILIGATQMAGNSGSFFCYLMLAIPRDDLTGNRQHMSNDTST